MGIFYQPQTLEAEVTIDPILEALDMDRIADANERRRQASVMLGFDVRKKKVALRNPDWLHVFLAFLLAGAVFGLALYLEGLKGHAESSKALLRAFEVLFTALLALLGIETAKQKS